VIGRVLSLVKDKLEETKQSVRLRETVEAAKTQKFMNNRELFEYLFERYPVYKWSCIFLVLYYLNVLFTCFERHMFLDQFIGLSLIGSAFIWINFNLLFTLKIIAGTLI
jgi:hypothetical protein